MKEEKREKDFLWGGESKEENNNQKVIPAEKKMNIIK